MGGGGRAVPRCCGMQGARQGVGMEKSEGMKANGEGQREGGWVGWGSGEGDGDVRRGAGCMLEFEEEQFT